MAIPWLFISITHDSELACVPHRSGMRESEMQINATNSCTNMLNTIKGITFSVVEHLVFMIVFEHRKCARSKAARCKAYCVTELCKYNVRSIPSIYWWSHTNRFAPAAVAAIFSISSWCRRHHCCCWCCCCYWYNCPQLNCLYCQHFGKRTHITVAPMARRF